MSKNSDPKRYEKEFGSHFSKRDSNNQYSGFEPPASARNEAQIPPHKRDPNTNWGKGANLKFDND